MTPPIKFLPASKNKIIWTLVASITLLTCIYYGIFKTNDRSGLFGDAWFLLLFGVNSVDALRKLWLDTSGLLYRKIISYLVFLVTITLISTVVWQMRKVYRSSQLANQSQVIDAKVDLIMEATEFPDYRDQRALILYQFNKKNYLQEVNNENLHLIKDERIKVRISVQHPEIMEVTGDTQ